ncbi:MAG: NAD-dependent epimerase/dehydratase family protein [Alphaproteobacteria bacterium]|jgi:UDP-glucuronate 4-epimerase|nr:NAD-dependent epimerase/dehydratase family protein [Alphaproteobacteria bacterium]MBT5389817.1 NAD-dependent epimerase/dehydratase family protein [Alphaproteobacteria bacterium]MBT5654511.1 NAD-dependent epimerase/dehydratase family protein [Alphaproteobacteria bacterium]
MGRKILVTGVGGFIGFHLSKTLLERGERVIGIDNMNAYYDVSVKKGRLEILQGYENFSFNKIELSNREDMTALWNRESTKSAPIVHVINLAAQAGVRYSLEDPYAYIQSNVMGHLVLLELARHQEGFEKFVYASSSSVYGANKKLPFATEDRTDTPISIYAASKKADELMSYTYASLYGIPAVGLRFFTVYGPWGRPDMAAFKFAKNILAGEPIQVYGNGEMCRDFTYVDDIVQGIIGALNVDLHKKLCGETPHKVYNLGNNNPVQLLDFIKTIERILGKKAIIDLLPMQMGDVRKTYADITESQNDLGYDPKTHIDEGLQNFLAWYQEFYGDKRTLKNAS